MHAMCSLNRLNCSSTCIQAAASRTAAVIPTPQRMSAEEAKSMEPAVNAANEEAEAAKKRGNDSFLEKKYDDAITHYSKAIELDPNSAVYFSNRSACYALKGQWDKVIEDATACISKDNKFIKGYYRLVSAYLELGRLSEAEVTLNTALRIDPKNEMILKQVKQLREKTSGGKKKPQKKLTEEQLREVYELQDQLNTHQRDLNGVKSRVSTVQRETRALQVTESQIKILPDTVPLFRAIGKAFLLAPKAAVEECLVKDMENNAKTQRDLLDRKEYLERRITSGNADLLSIVS